MMSRRLLGLLLLSLALSAWVMRHRESDEGWQATSPRSAAAPTTAKQAVPEVDGASSAQAEPWRRIIQLPRGAGPEHQTSAIPSLKGLVRPLPAPVAPVSVAPINTPPVVPKPPPVGLQFMGRVFQDEGTILYVLFRDESYAVRVGDTIDDTYRIEAIADGRAKLRYLPLNAVQDWVFEQ